MSWEQTVIFYRWNWNLFRQMPVDLEGIAWDAETEYATTNDPSAYDMDLDLWNDRDLTTIWNDSDSSDDSY